LTVFGTESGGTICYGAEIVGGYIGSVFAAGTAIGTVVQGAQFILGGVAIGTTVIGQQQFFEGTAISTVLEGGARQLLGYREGGGLAISTTLLSGSEQDVGYFTGAGIAIATAIEGGSQFVGYGLSGFWTAGTAISTTIEDGGVQYLGQTGRLASRTAPSSKAAASNLSETTTISAPVLSSAPRSEPVASRSWSWVHQRAQRLLVLAVRRSCRVARPLWAPRRPIIPLQ
jgi:hypothetical protein